MKLLKTLNTLELHFHAIRCNGGFVNNIKELKKQGNRAIFGLIKKAREGHLPIDIQFDLFDKQILPKLLYGCEIWGYEKLVRI